MLQAVHYNMNGHGLPALIVLSHYTFNLALWLAPPAIKRTAPPGYEPVSGAFQKRQIPAKEGSSGQDHKCPLEYGEEKADNPEHNEGITTHHAQQSLYPAHRPVYMTFFLLRQ